ncbi:MAG: YtxH domain-containing protein [Cyclobacteriaceae bacterium]|nr:YtxH domain-containing protein [Cyclobacteriaceae bacterium]
MNTGFKVLTGFFIGAITGITIGLLTAPDSGIRTRKKLQKDAQRFAEDFSDSALKKFKEAKDELNDTLEDYIKKGKGQVEKLGKTVSKN